MGREQSEWETIDGSPTRSGERSVRSAAGAEARVEPRERTEVIAVRDRRGQLVFEHDAETGRSVIYAPSGDLELRADHGSVSFVARDAVRLRGEREVEIATRNLTTTAARAEVTLDEGRLIARALRTVVEDGLHTAVRWTLEAQRIVERSKDVYREAEGLSQTRAGRMRHVVASTFHLLAARAVMKAEEDLKLKADKIHLA